MLNIPKTLYMQSVLFYMRIVLNPLNWGKRSNYRSTQMIIRR